MKRGRSYFVSKEVMEQHFKDTELANRRHRDDERIDKTTTSTLPIIGKSDVGSNFNKDFDDRVDKQVC